MNATGEESKNYLIKLMSSLTKEQAEDIIDYLPLLIALLEEPKRPFQQELFLRTG
jgi:hypothetical protein